MLEHIAAFLKVAAPPQRPLRDLVAEIPSFAHVVVHWTGQAAKSLDPAALVRRVTAHARGSRVDVLTRPDLSTNPGAVVARLTVRDRVTSTGFDLLPPWTGIVDEWRGRVAASSRLASLGATEV